MNIISKAADATVSDISDRKRSAVFTITTDAVDRQREVIVPKGLDLKQYMKNKVVLASHDAQSWPVGKSTWIKPYDDGRELRAMVAFAETERAEEVWQLVKADVVRGASISMIPDQEKAGPPTAKELKERPDWAKATRIYRKGELVEWSIVPIPANPEALVVAVSKGLKLPGWASPPEAPALPRLTGCRTFGEAHAELIRSIRAQNVTADARREAQERLELLQGRI